MYTSIYVDVRTYMYANRHTDQIRGKNSAFFLSIQFNSAFAFLYQVKNPFHSGVLIGYSIAPLLR